MDCIVHGVAKSRTPLSDFHFHINIGVPPVAQMEKNLPAVQETQVQSLGQEHLLEKGTATHSSTILCNSFSELSEVLSPGLSYSFCPNKI